MSKNLIYISILLFFIGCSPVKQKRIVGPQISFDTNYLWKNGSTLKVYFHHGNADIHKRIITIANTWCDHCNIRFVQTKKNNLADIKISFRSGGYSSYIGTMAARPTYDTTMCLQDIESLKDSVLFTSIILHEFGHALGCLHEHQSPLSSITWNLDSVYIYYESPMHKWNKEMIDKNILSTITGPGINSSEYDTASIMHYPLAKAFTKNGFEINWKGKLSETDKKYINILYPKTKKP